MVRILFFSIVLCLFAGVATAQIPPASSANYKAMTEACTKSSNPADCRKAVARREKAGTAYDEAARTLQGFDAAQAELVEANRDLSQRFSYAWERRNQK